MNGAYSWCRLISSQLFLMIGDFEVMLRSHLHVCLSKKYVQLTSNSEYWFIDYEVLSNIYNQYQDLPRKPSKTQLKTLKNSVRFSSPFQLSPDCQSMVINAVLDLLKKNRRHFPLPDDIVANLSFGFWVSLMNGLKHPYHANSLSSVLREIFPNFQGNFNINLLNEQVDTLFRLKNIRNRISHQDSILKTPESKYPKREFIPRTPQHLIISLRRLMELLGLFLVNINPVFLSDVKKTQYWMLLNTLLDINILEVLKISGGDTSSYLLPILLSQFNAKHNSSIHQFINSSSSLSSFSKINIIPLIRNSYINC